METGTSLPRSSSAKLVLRKSGKRVEQAMISTEGFISLPVTKEGTLLLQGHFKWKPLYFALCGNVLYWKKKETSTAIVGEISLKGAKVEKISTGPKNTFAFQISSEDKTLHIAADKESLQEEWITEILQSLDKPPSSAPTSGRKDTRMLRAQKRVGGTIATSAAGKKIIREALGPEGYKGITIVKKVVTAVDGKKRAKEVEELLIRIGVKIILLAKNKDLTMQDLLKHRDSIKGVCDLMSKCAQFTFEYTSALVQSQITVLISDTEKTLQHHLSPKNMTRLNELEAYLSSPPILDMLFTDPEMRDWKKEWHYLMKNLSSRLDME